MSLYLLYKRARIVGYLAKNNVPSVMLTREASCHVSTNCSVVIGCFLRQHDRWSNPYPLPEYLRTAHSTDKNARITKKIHFRFIRSFKSSSAVITGL